MCGNIGNRQYVNCWIELFWLICVGSLLNNIVNEINEDHGYIDWRLQAYYLQQIGIIAVSFLWRVIVYR